ncbi:MAG: endonuclease/exonuclease/phosphatase family protein, partial [Planctomycetota bacterium]
MIDLMLAIVMSLTGPAPSLAASCDDEPHTTERAADAGPVDLSAAFTFRMCVRMDAAPADLPTLAANKAWANGAVRDYTTNNAFGLGRESGAVPGFAISVLPDGAWTWNAGNGRSRVDHRPEAADQGIADGRWHEVGFAFEPERGVARLFHDGRQVAIHDLGGVSDLSTDAAALTLASEANGIEVDAVRLEPGGLSRELIATQFIDRFGDTRSPPTTPTWDGSPHRILAWNIWHGGRRKGRDEGVQRVVDVIRACDADIVLMQETYGSGPRI